MVLARTSRKILIVILGLSAIFTVFTSENTAGAQTVVEGLISYWNLDNISANTVKDVLGSGDGTLIGDPQAIDGKAGKALKLDGVDDYVNCGNDESLNFERTDTFSIQAWVNKEGDNHEVIAAKMRSTGDYRGWLLWFRKEGAIGTVIRSDWPSRNLIEVNTVETFANSEWHHIVMTYDGTSKASGVKIYVDGAGTTSNVVHDALSDTIKTDLNVDIGARDDSTSFFKGTIDEVGIYNRVLSEDEVKQNFVAEGVVSTVEPFDKLSLTWGEIKIAK